MSHSLTRRSLTVLVAAVFLAAACSSGRTQNQPPPPPTVTFQNPAEGSFLHGTITLDAKAVGQVKIANFKFDAPTALSGIVATLDPTTKSATLSAPLDLSSFPDGTLKVTVTAKDELGGSSTKDLTFTVAAKAPTISIGSPATGATVTGTAVAVTATAAAQVGANITKLELIDPPLGMGTNTSAAAAFFAATWNSKAALEGPATLHFRATDSTGLVGDSSITVTVDNVPQGQLDTYVFAGAPVKDAHIEVWALDNNTGAVDTSAGASGLLGTGGPTDASGHALVTLSAENFSGPIQLQAKAASGTTLQYVDPADPGSGYVQIPSALILTSIMPAYSTGQAISTPVTLTTTLADVELLAYVGGQHRLHPGPHTVTGAAAYGDGLFTQHVQASTPRWNLRNTVPVDLTAGPTTLTDRAYAAFTDIALNQLGKDLGAQIHVSGVITAPFLISKLGDDLAADGQLDGKGAGGVAITTQTGSPPYAFDENTLRVRLANALDTWIQSARNVSTLDRSSLAGAAVYTTISGDTSELFGPAAPIGFDNAAPSVAVAITYGPSNLAPFAGAYVSGTAKIIITATDASGVKSLSAKLGNQILDSAATTVASPDGQTLTYTAVVTTTTYADMTYTLSVTTTDQRNNTATTTPTSLTIDNTPPFVSQAQPAAVTYYSLTASFDATASDGTGSGVASLTAAGFAGLTDGDGSATHFLGTWTLPAGASDGPVNGNWTTCDNVGNCASPAISVHVDRTAPSVAMSGNAPAYVNANILTLTVTATDAGAGVAAVYAQAPGDSLRSGTLSAGVWTIPGVTLQPGRNFIAIWAVDNASPPNGSSSSGISLPVIYDTGTPTADLLTTGTYNDERGLQIASDASGVAVTPAVYSFTPATSTKTAIALNGDIYKASTRLSWTTTPTAAILEGTNPENIPFIQVNVACDTTSQAPITTAQYQVAVTCPTCSFTPTPWADLIVSSINAAGSGKNVYDLPLAANNIPALATALPATAQLSITIRLSDAAGNNGTGGPWAFNVHVVGAPVSIGRDPSWTTSGDPKGTGFYPLAGGAYTQLWNPSNTNFYAGQVRLVRYVLSNPAPTPVAVALSYTQLADGSWKAYETIAATTMPTRSPCATGQSAGGCTDPTPTFTANGVTLSERAGFQRNVAASSSWSFPSWVSGVPGKVGFTGSPCSAADFDAHQCYPRHAWNYTTGFWDPANPYYKSPTDYVFAATSVLQASSPVTVQPYTNPVYGGGETSPPPPLAGGYVTVPAANANTPGQLALYVLRSAAVPRTGNTTTVLPWNGSAYAALYETVYPPDYWCTQTSGLCPYFLSNEIDVNRTMSAASESIGGTLNAISIGIVGTTPYGNTSAQTVPVNVTISH